jgi:hypothetical protein
MVLFRSLQHRRVSINTVCATLAAYLLIGLIFTTIYRLYGQIAPPFFVQYADGGNPSPGEYTYFSIITLTTVGFGDLSAASDPGRAFVMTEAVVGQVFLVTMLARVVAMLGAQRPAYELVDPANDPDDGSAPGRGVRLGAPAAATEDRPDGSSDDAGAPAGSPSGGSSAARRAQTPETTGMRPSAAAWTRRWKSSSF